MILNHFLVLVLEEFCTALQYNSTATTDKISAFLFVGDAVE